MNKVFRFSWSLALNLLLGAAAFAQHYTQTNLVSNVSGIAPVTDPQLVNSWGLSRGSGTAWWVSDQATGFSTLYDGAGSKQSLIVAIPPADPTNKNTPIGSPTGTIFNGSQADFLLAPGQPAAFLFSTIDGTLAAWNPNVALGPGAAPPSTHAVTVFKSTDGSSYTGLTGAVVDGKSYLFAANFTKGRVDIFDNMFRPVNIKSHPTDAADDTRNVSDHRGPFPNDAFTDEQLPEHYVPFNVQAIGNDVVVTYALHEGSSPFETNGPGLGFVDIFSANGQLLKRLQHGDWLNAPWGVALAPLDFGRFSHHLLIGQFAGGGDTQSSGLIAAYDLVTGRFDGVLEDASGKPLAINGIWALSPGNVSPKNSDAAVAPAATVYFTAGPNHGSGGLFGHLTAVSNELATGNDQ